jgi:rod shape-determining protein MreD
VSPWIVIVLMGALLQATLLSYLTPFGVHPNLILVLAICWGVLRGGRAGLIWGMAGGLILDLYSSAPFGTFTIALLLTTAMTGIVEISVFNPTFLLPVGIVLLASPLFHVISTVMMQTLGWQVTWARVASVIPAAALIDGLLALLLFPLLRRLSALAGQRAIDWSKP